MSLTHLPATFRRPWPGTIADGAPDRDREILVDVWFDRAGDAAADARLAAALGALPATRRTYEARGALASRTQASAHAFSELERYVRAHGLHVRERSWRCATIGGRLHDAIAAFGAHLEVRVDPNGARFTDRSGWLHLPLHLANHVCGVFGMHGWMRVPRAGALPAHDQHPPSARHLARHYAFPNARGEGSTIAILSYAGFRDDDFALAMRHQGVERERPVVKSIERERAGHRAPNVADVEVATDVQVAGALAPGARIVVYEAPHDERGCLAAIRAAIFDEDERPAILSISYGIVERHWTPAALVVLDELFVAAALLGISVFAASGDHGAELDERGRPHVNAPASSPFVMACGATVLADVPGREAAWRHGGGGFAAAPAPAWQHPALAWAARHGTRAGRGVPDVAAQCDPGHLVVVDGRVVAMQGTSTVAPLWAALAARVNDALSSARGEPTTIGFFAPLLYAQAATAMRPVRVGGNGYYEARAGWNPCAGLGVPNGAALEAALRGP